MTCDNNEYDYVFTCIENKIGVIIMLVTYVFIYIKDKIVD